MSEFERAARALARNTVLVGFGIGAQLACLLDGPLNENSFINLAVMCAMFAISLLSWMTCGERHRPQLLVTAWGSFIGITIMATLDVMIAPHVLPGILYINLWGVWALYETVGRASAYLFAGAVVVEIVTFGALTGGRGITAVMVIGLALCFVADLVTLRREVDEMTRCAERFSNVITGNHPCAD